MYSLLIELLLTEKVHTVPLKETALCPSFIKFF